MTAMSRTQVNELRQQILFAVEKLGDRDTAENSATELQHLARQLESDQSFHVLLHTLIEGLGNPHYAKHAFTRKYIMLVLGALGAEFMPRLSRRHVSKLCATFFRHIDDSDSHVREACADSFASIAQSYTAEAAATVSGAAGEDAAPRGGKLALFLQFIFDTLGKDSKGASRYAQIGAGLCLARLIARIPATYVTPTLPRLCYKLEQHLSNRGCHAHTELLQATANLAEVCRDELCPHVPLGPVCKCLQVCDAACVYHPLCRALTHTLC